MAEKKKNDETLEAAEKVAKAVKEKKQNANKPKGDKPGVFSRMGKAIAKFFKNFRGETKKIVWPDAKTVFKNTGIVLIVIIVIGAFIWLIDFGLSKSVNGLSDLADKVGATQDAETDTDAEGEIELEEGSRLNAVVRGITKKTRKDLLDKLPLDVHAAIYQRDGYKTVVFDLDEKYK